MSIIQEVAIQFLGGRFSETAKLNHPTLAPRRRQVIKEKLYTALPGAVPILVSEIESLVVVLRDKMLITAFRRLTRIIEAQDVRAHCSAHFHSLRLLYLETTTFFQPQRGGVRKSGRITYDRVAISIQASRLRTHTCTQWCSLGAKTQTIFSKASGKSNVRYLTVLSLTPLVGILAVVCRRGNPCWAFRHLSPHLKNFRRISWYSASQASSLRR